MLLAEGLPCTTEVSKNVLWAHTGASTTWGKAGHGI